MLLTVQQYILLLSCMPVTDKHICTFKQVVVLKTQTTEIVRRGKRKENRSFIWGMKNAGNGKIGIIT